MLRDERHWRAWICGLALLVAASGLGLWASAGPAQDRLLLPGEADGIAWLLERVRQEINPVPRDYPRAQVYPGTLPPAPPPAGQTRADWWEAYASSRWQRASFGVYTGPGAEPLFWQALTSFLQHQGVDWDTFDETELDQLSRFDIILLGGGYSAHYRRGVGEHQLIREFVRAGGTFVGICAGAYYATRTMHWQGGTTDYPLQLLDGAGIGPIAGLPWGALTAVELNPRHPANHHQGEVMELYYMDGPYFTFADSQAVEVLARYPGNGEAAVITFPYGQGRVLLLGPHPEMGYDAQAGRFVTDGRGGAQWSWLAQLLKYALTR